MIKYHTQMIKPLFKKYQVQAGYFTNRHTPELIGVEIAAPVLGIAAVASFAAGDTGCGTANTGNRSQRTKRTSLKSKVEPKDIASSSHRMFIFTYSPSPTIPRAVEPSNLATSSRSPGVPATG